QAEDGIRDFHVTGVQTCALPIYFDIKSGRTGTASAQALLGHAAAHRLDVQWILETHAHADHLSAGHWLKSRLPGATLAIGSGIQIGRASCRETRRTAGGARRRPR